MSQPSISRFFKPIAATKEKAAAAAPVVTKDVGAKSKGKDTKDTSSSKKKRKSDAHDDADRGEDDASSSSSSSWKCCHCTYQNKGLTKSCTMCNNTRETNETKIRAHEGCRALKRGKRSLPLSEVAEDDDDTMDIPASCDEEEEEVGVKEKKKTEKAKQVVADDDDDDEDYAISRDDVINDDDDDDVTAVKKLSKKHMVENRKKGESHKAGGKKRKQAFDVDDDDESYEAEATLFPQHAYTNTSSASRGLSGLAAGGKTKEQKGKGGKAKSALHLNIEDDDNDDDGMEDNDEGSEDEGEEVRNRHKVKGLQNGVGEVQFDLSRNKQRQSSFRRTVETVGRGSEWTGEEDEEEDDAGDDGDEASEDEDGKKGSSKRTKSPSPLKIKTKGKGGAGGAKYTPMEQQVIELKKKHPGVLLLVECGYRFRFFGDDAVKAADVLGIYAHKDNNFMVASIPTFRLAVHLRRLVEAGHKVGVVNQTETAALKSAGLTSSGKKSGTFLRELTAVFSQATWVEGAADMLVKGGVTDQGQQGDTEESAVVAALDRDRGSEEVLREQFLVSLCEEQVPLEERVASLTLTGRGPLARVTTHIGLCAIDVRTGVLVYDSFPDDDQRSELETRLRHLQPLELLLPARVEEGVDDDDDEGEEDTGSNASLFGLGLSIETEKQLRAYREKAADSKGRHRIVRVERCERSRFDFDGAHTVLNKTFTASEDAGKKDGSSNSGGGGSGGGGSGGGGSGGSANEQTTQSLLAVMDLPRLCLTALGPLLTHLQRFGLSRALTAHPILKPFSSTAHMALDAVTLRDLEVLACQADGKEAGSLLWLLQHTVTPFGFRTLKDWVRKPLLQRDAIIERQAAVKELASPDIPACLTALRTALKAVGQGPDVEPLVASMHYGNITPKRMLTLLNAMSKLTGALHGEKTIAPTSEDISPTASIPGHKANSATPYSSVKANLLREVLSKISYTLREAVQTLREQVVQAKAKNDEVIGVLADGALFYPALAEADLAVEEAEEALMEELQNIRKVLRKPKMQYKTLRQGATSQLENLIELRHAEVKKLARSDWVEVNRTKDLIRYHTPKVISLQQELLRGREEQVLASHSAWKAFVKVADEKCYGLFRKTLQAFGELDAIFSLAHVAQLPGYVCPEYKEDDGGQSVEYDNGGKQGSKEGVIDGDDGDNMEDSEGDDDSESSRRQRKGVIRVIAGRHPTVEQYMEGQFVPSDVCLSLEGRPRNAMIVTGPNMGGKTSYVRMVALLSILGQIGSFVPAASAELCVLDAVYTRMGAGDDLVSGMSTFMLELWHTSSILRRATSRSLVILDELGRGTSTFDGLAIALATLKHIVLNIGCPTLFVTHFPELAQLADGPALKGRVVNGHMGFIEEDEEAEDESENVVESGVEDDGQERPAALKNRRKRITFLYQLVEGCAKRSYGLNTARAAGLDDDVLDLAAKKAEELRKRSECRLLSRHSDESAGANNEDADNSKNESVAQEALLKELTVLLQTAMKRPAGGKGEGDGDCNKGNGGGDESRDTTAEVARRLKDIHGKLKESFSIMS